ncbi:MAG: hypothetical protein V1716_01840 [Candidatus Uhrbacteria bacterium]
MNVYPQDFDNWKDYAEAMMSAQAASHAAMTVDELVAMVDGGEVDGILFQSLAKKKDLKKGAPALFRALKSFEKTDKDLDSIRFMLVESIYDLCRFNHHGYDDRLFSELIGKVKDEDSWQASLSELEKLIDKKIKV